MLVDVIDFRKCNYAKSPYIRDIIGLYAFKDWFNENEGKEVLLYSRNQRLRESLREWCLENSTWFSCFQKMTKD